MAHAFVYMRPFMTSSIVGGTSLSQLEVALELPLSRSVMRF